MAPRVRSEARDGPRQEPRPTRARRATAYGATRRRPAMRPLQSAGKRTRRPRMGRHAAPTRRRPHAHRERRHHRPRHRGRRRRPAHPVAPRRLREELRHRSQHQAWLRARRERRGRLRHHRRRLHQRLARGRERPRHRRRGRAHRRGAPRHRDLRGGLRRAQARGHGQQGPAWPPCRAPGRTGTRGGRPASLRGRGSRWHPGGQRHRAQPHGQPLPHRGGHPQRHHQLHPVPYDHRRTGLRGGSRRRAAPGLRRGGPVGRRRRL